MSLNPMSLSMLHSSHQTAAALKAACIHCGNPVPVQMNSEFCCVGCETVYHWIQDHELGKYYELKDKARSVRKASAARDELESFRYLDDPEFVAQYAWATPEGRWMDFYVEGVHCAACVWLTEKIAEIVDHVGYIRLNLGSSVATVRIDSQGSFAAVALELQKMGYRPHPVQRGEGRDLQKTENRRFLVRIGVSGACAGNIMLLAISLYGGANGTMATWFRWLSFGLFLPVISYCALPFYKSAYSAIRSKELSIDIPVLFGILLGSVVSTVNLFTGDERIYFDSLSALIFLLLSTRYVLKRAQQSALESSQLMRFLTPSTVQKWNAANARFETVNVDLLCVDDQVRVLPGDSIPADGIVLKGESLLDCSLLTGESELLTVGEGQLVFAGTANLDSPLEIRVTRSGSKTRIGQILGSMESLLSRRAPVAHFADRISRYFVAAVVLISAVTFIWAAGVQWHEGLNRALAIAIVTCPCTFALITPLVLSMTLGRLARAGMLVRGPDVIESLSRVHTVFLDKTGTLTRGTPEVVCWEVPQELSIGIHAIESCSRHPMARAIVQYLKEQLGVVRVPQVEELKERAGYGISGRFGGDWIELVRSPIAHIQGAGQSGSEISVSKNGFCVGRIVLNDTLRPDSRGAVAQLQAAGLETWILSGDQQGPVLEIAEQVGIEPEHCCAGVSPEEKSEIIKAHPHSIMVGDGANDAIALAQSEIGIAVHGGVEISMRAADVYLKHPGVQALSDLITVSRECMRVVRRNLAFSLVYNVIAGGFAIAGKIDPLFAAVLMPASALTVFLSSVAGTSKLRRAFRRLET